MAERRMFAKVIVTSDAFLDMPMSARCLYFTLGMFADDDGFVGNPKAIMRQCGASKDDLIVLLQKRYILAFESGVIVIKHWRMNNYLQKDRYKHTTYIEEFESLMIDERGAYTEKAGKQIPSDAMYTECIQPVYTDKDRLVEDSKGKDKECKHTHGEFKNVLLTDKEYEKLKKEFPETDEAIEFLSAYIAEKGYKSKSHYLAIRRWVINAVKERKGKPKGMMTKDTNISDLEKRLLAN